MNGGPSRTPLVTRVPRAFPRLQPAPTGGNRSPPILTQNLSEVGEPHSMRRIMMRYHKPWQALASDHKRGKRSQAIARSPAQASDRKRLPPSPYNNKARATAGVVGDRTAVPKINVHVDFFFIWIGVLYTVKIFSQTKLNPKVVDSCPR